ncbi:hypothetical protein LTR66_002401 [Elasticomyces elasticus]|nr:hypothetical protein LTR66_002401 [Elasticomyces elasticus]
MAPYTARKSASRTRWLWSCFSGLERTSHTLHHPIVEARNQQMLTRRSLREKAFLIIKATRQHARNLALFALIYKSTLLGLNTINDGKEAPSHTFLSGLLGGYMVFGRGRAARSSVNQQIVIYVFARVVLALAKLSVAPPGPNELVGGKYGYERGLGLGKAWINPETRESLRRGAWPVFASLSWAGVMWLFRWYPEMVQPSLRSSMTYIYDNADRWDSFRNLLIHNK